MHTLSLSIFLSSCILAAAIFAPTWYEQQKPAPKIDPDKENIYTITPSGNLIRYNKKTLEMTLCGLSDQSYRCLNFEK